MTAGMIYGVTLLVEHGDVYTEGAAGVTDYRFIAFIADSAGVKNTAMYTDSFFS